MNCITPKKNILSIAHNILFYILIFHTVNVFGQETVVIKYEYDHLERLTEVNSSEEDTIIYFYDEVGNLLWISKTAPCSLDSIQELERNALKAIYEDMDGANWSTVWDTTSCEHCLWEGIGCNSDGRVDTISLGNKGLNGTLPIELFELTTLKFLFLFGNTISGGIPSNLGDLNKLEFLHLGIAGLTGEIPESIGDLSKLSFLVLNGNSLTGAIPSSFEDLDSLSYCNLSFCQLSGQIPNAFGEMENLATLFLNYNSLSGSIPISLADAPKLNILDISNNELNGCYAQELKSLCSLPLINNSDISSGNNFDADWEDFCTDNEGQCCTVYTTASDGDGSLREAISCAESGDTILFTPSVIGQMIDLTTPIHINKDLVIKQTATTIVDIGASFSGPLFTIGEGHSFYFENTDIYSGIGTDDTRAIHNMGELTLKNVNIFDSLNNSDQGATILNEGVISLLGNCNIKLE